MLSGFINRLVVPAHVTFWRDLVQTGVLKYTIEEYMVCGQCVPKCHNINFLLIFDTSFNQISLKPHMIKVHQGEPVNLL